MKAYTASVGDYPPVSDVHCFGAEGVFQQPVMEAKRYKVLPHLFFPKESVTIWMDSNIRMKADVDAEVIALAALMDHDIAVFKHPYRSSVYQEFDTLQDDPRFAIPYLQRQLKEQRKAYIDEGLPASTPLFECNVLVRRNNERVNRLMDAWWAQICRWQWRDQVSFPYVLWKYASGVAVKAITPNVREHHLFDYVSKY
jgi:hypothetical protein